jgi:hypothetical protein
MKLKVLLLDACKKHGYRAMEFHLANLSYQEKKKKNRKTNQEGSLPSGD